MMEPLIPDCLIVVSDVQGQGPDPLGTPLVGQGQMTSVIKNSLGNLWACYIQHLITK